MSLLPPYKRVFAVVVTHNGMSWLDKCLGSLQRSQYPIGIIVVDNQSTDKTVDYIQEYFPSVILIPKQLNLGFGKANNIGMAHALKHEAEYVFLLNQDAWVEPHTVGTLIEAMDLNLEYGILSPMHYTGLGDKLDYGFEQYLLREFTPDQVNRIVSSGSGLHQRVSFINAAAWMMRKECLERVGGFGDLFFHYGEDHDYTNRMAYYKLKIGFISGCKIFHDRVNRRPVVSAMSFNKKVNYYTTGWLFRATDINYSFLRSFVTGKTWSLKESIVHSFSGRFDFAVVFLIVLIKMCSKVFKIINYRLVTKSCTPYLFITLK
jgi:GT2 family glycosyltransferase